MFLLLTPRLTLGMGFSSEFVGHHFLDGPAVGLVHHRVLAEITLAVGRFLGQDVAFVRFFVQDFLSRRHLEPFLGSPVGF